ncbi:MAG: hypothetical protein WBE76_17680 [Terracidiphilus sp.]
MSKLKVMNGTPSGNGHLCRSCSNGQYVVGYRESDVLVICTNPYPAMVVPFTVYECSDYSDRNRPSFAQMQRLALSFGNTRRRPTPGFRATGFASVASSEEGGCVDGDENEDEDEATCAF